MRAAALAAVHGIDAHGYLHADAFERAVLDGVIRDAYHLVEVRNQNLAVLIANNLSKIFR